MPRSDLATQTITVAGLSPTYSAANADGHAFLNRGRTFLHVKNASAGALTVTVVTPITVGGRAVEDDTFSVPADSELMIGPFQPRVFNNTGEESNKVHVNYSAATSITVAAFNL